LCAARVVAKDATMFSDINHTETNLLFLILGGLLLDIRSILLVRTARKLREKVTRVGLCKVGAVESLTLLSGKDERSLFHTQSSLAGQMPIIRRSRIIPKAQAPDGQGPPNSNKLFSTHRHEA
jgi:hypothetical protein